MSSKTPSTPLLLSPPPAQLQSQSPAGGRTLDETLTLICNSLSVVAYQTLQEDLAASSSNGMSSGTKTATTISASTPSTVTQTRSRRASTTTGTGQQWNAASIELDMQRYIELAARNILSRLPGATLWSILSNINNDNTSDPSSSGSALSGELMATLQSSVCAEGRSGVMDVLSKRLGAFLTMKFDEQLALSALVQRSVCLLCVVVLASSASDSSGSNGANMGTVYLMQAMELLKVVDRLWKEIRGYVQRLPNGF